MDNTCTTINPESEYRAIACGCEVSTYTSERTAPLFSSQHGQQLGERVWDELAEKLEAIQHGVLSLVKAKATLLSLLLKACPLNRRTIAKGSYRSGLTGSDSWAYPSFPLSL